MSARSGSSRGDREWGTVGDELVRRIDMGDHECGQGAAKREELLEAQKNYENRQWIITAVDENR